MVSTAKLQQDLHGWTDLYLAGRMHKPVLTLQDDPERIAPAVQANLDAGLRCALLLLPERFSEQQLFRTVAGLSYLGDWRMQVGENPVRRPAALPAPPAPPTPWSFAQQPRP